MKITFYKTSIAPEEINEVICAVEKESGLLAKVAASITSAIVLCFWSRGPIVL